MLAGECLGRAKDYGGLLLLASCAGSVPLVNFLNKFMGAPQWHSQDLTTGGGKPGIPWKNSLASQAILNFSLGFQNDRGGMPPPICLRHWYTVPYTTSLRY